jgi:hypothetical protein
MGFCHEHRWEKGYMGPQRPNQCLTCFNNVGKDKRGRVLCGFQKYQNEQGEWCNTAGKTHDERLVDCGRAKVRTPVKPDPRPKPEYVCDGYEDNKGRTREQIRLEDPLFFYSRDRFW